MKSYACAAMIALQILMFSPAFGQTLPPITSKMLSFSVFVYSGTPTVITTNGPFALTSAQFTYFGQTQAYAIVERLQYTGANCTGSPTQIGRTLYANFAGYQSVQYSYPTPLVFFPDSSNLTCVSISNSGAGLLFVNLVGYTQ